MKRLQLDDSRPDMLEETHLHLNSWLELSDVFRRVIATLDLPSAS